MRYKIPRSMISSHDTIRLTRSRADAYASREELRPHIRLTANGEEFSSVDRV